MRITEHADTSREAAKASSAPTVAPVFVLFFAMTPDAASQLATTPAGLEPMPERTAQSYRSQMDSVQRHLLGESYAQATRLERTAVGRLRLPDGPHALTHADIFLAIHQCGAAVWEVCLFGPPQPIDVARWVGWLDLATASSPARIIWDTLAAGGQRSAPMAELYMPLAVLRFGDGPLGALVERHDRDLVTLLHRDASGGRFKASFVRDELAADFCRREDSAWLLARNGALHVQAHSHDSEEWTLPHDALPLLLTLEVLCFDRAVLRSFLVRIARRAHGTVGDLIQLRRDIFENLEDYYGTLAQTHGYTADAIARGETLFGIDDLFEAVVDRLEALSFEITTGNQESVNRLGLWLTTAFGAIDTGFVASSIATWYYPTNVLAVLSWTVGVTVVAALAIASFMRWKMKP